MTLTPNESLPRNTITPRIVTSDVAKLVAFIKRVFDAHGDLEIGRPSEITIGNSSIMISNGGGVRGDMPAFLYVYVENVDQTFDTAVRAGATVIDPPADMPWGDRRATISDAWGNFWQIASMKPKS
jgi:PhnB protein